MCREAQAAGICIIRHIPGTENPADILTKALPSTVFWKHVWNFMEEARKSLQVLKIHEKPVESSEEKKRSELYKKQFKSTS
jgi:hypothetical protein